MVKVTKTLYVTNRDEWRKWLEKNHDKRKEIWLIYYKKHTGKPRIPYDDAVEEALCFGWIDSTVKRLDDERYTQRYTPRNDKSVWSEINKRRIKKMIKEGRMTEFGLSKFRKLKETRNLAPDNPRMPSDLKEALKGNGKAEKNFKAFAKSYKKMYYWWIMTAKMPETRRRRIKKVVELAEKNMKTIMG